jgi:hypothetical protein
MECERLTLSFAAISSDQPARRVGRLGARGSRRGPSQVQVLLFRFRDYCKLPGLRFQTCNPWAYERFSGSRRKISDRQPKFSEPAGIAWRRSCQRDWDLTRDPQKHSSESVSKDLKQSAIAKAGTGYMHSPLLSSGSHEKGVTCAIPLNDSGTAAV